MTVFRMNRIIMRRWNRLCQMYAVHGNRHHRHHHCILLLILLLILILLIVITMNDRNTQSVHPAKRYVPLHCSGTRTDSFTSMSDIILCFEFLSISNDTTNTITYTIYYYYYYISTSTDTVGARVRSLPFKRDGIKFVLNDPTGRRG